MLWSAVVCDRAHAQVPSQAGRTGLAAADRVLLPAGNAPPITLAATAGYGITESQAGEGAHHRTGGTLAVGLGLSEHLGLSLAFAGRYDRHPDGDDGALAAPELQLVAGGELEPGLRIGAGLSLALPGRQAPSLDFQAPQLAMSALAAWSTRRFTLAALAGFRLDESAHAAPDVAQLSRADRLALGLSDFDAVPLGLAAIARLPSFWLLGELSAELLVGQGAPSWLRSPLRAALGVRLPLFDRVSGEALAELSLSQRPAYGRVGPLLPVEPRFGLGVGLRYAPSVVAPPPTPAPVRVEPARTEVVGRVLDPDGVGLPGARVSVRVGDQTRTARSGPDGRFVLRGLPRGRAQMRVEGPHLVATLQWVELGGPHVVSTLHAARIEGGAQLRGLVRSFAGTPLPAVVRVPVAEVTVHADKDGRFVLELPAGEYEVEIECDGYLTQRREVSMQDNGVTLLDVELHEAQP